MGLFYRHTLCLYQPPWTADWSKNDDVRLVREAFCEHSANDAVVSYITKIDGHFAYVLPCAFSLGKENLDIFKHTLGLTDNIAGMNHHTLVVDTCSTADEDVSSVLIIHVCATLEAYTIVACAVEVGWGIEILYLILADTINGIVIQLHEDVRISLTTTYASRGYEMSLVGKSLMEEHVITSTNHTTIVEIHVSHEEPCADAVLFESTAFLFQLPDVFFEESDTRYLPPCYRHYHSIGGGICLA